MEEIIKIYNNEIGISFQWKHSTNSLTQIVFKDIGFHLYLDEIETFIEKITDAKHQKRCASCKLEENCRSILLQTPSNKISLAISLNELGQIEDLLKGTLFQLRLNTYLKELSKN